MTDLDGDEMTELVDADFPRVDLVGKGANGIPRFLIAKQDEDSAGLMDPEFVRGLIAKAEPDAPQSRRERVQTSNGVTINGSPADLMAFIHKASQRQADEHAEEATEPGEVAKAKYDAADRKRMAANGQAMKDESYPIADKGDLGKAIHAVGRGGSEHDAIRKHIISRAKSLGASSEIPDNWAADGSLKEASVSKTAGEKVAKDIGLDDLDLDDGADQMDPTVVLAAPEGDAPGDPTDPGSAAWESIDAATAQKWTSIAVRLKNALCVMSDREWQEAACADPDDADKAMDLQDAMCAVDYVIATLAVFAAGEQAEADLCAEAMEAIGKAMAGFDTAPLDTAEGLCAVAKSGRVLSGVNETHLREAHARLQTVLSSLPSAPAPDDGQQVAKQKETTVDGTQTKTQPGAEQVAKETASPETQAAASGPVSAGGTTRPGQPSGQETTPLPGDVPGRQVVKSALTLVFGRDRALIGVTDTAAILQQVAKADDGEKKAMQAVFDQDGDLIGIVDPDAIQPVTGAGGKQPAPDGTDMAADDPDAADMTPQPPAETGTPADAVPDDDTVTKQDSGPDAYSVLKSAVAEAVSAVLGAQSPQEGIAKQADVAELSQRLEAALDRIAKVEEQPAGPKVMSNGQVPPARQMRGQDQGAPQQVNVAKAQELKREMYTADPARAKQIQDELNQMAIDGISALHGR